MNCKDTICHLVECDCRLRMHECKLNEHREEICTETQVDCPLRCIGCPLKMKRREVIHHISVCPAYTVVCNMQRLRFYNTKLNLVSHLNPNLSEQIHFSSYIHDIALMRRVGKKTKQIEDELESNPCKEEIDVLVQSVQGCVCESFQGEGCRSVIISDSEAAITCVLPLRREEVTEHRIAHLSLSQQLRAIACPMQSYGCSYKPQAIELIPDRAVCRFDYDACGIVVDWEPVTSFEVDYDRISYLPYNVMRMILGSLDSLSLRNLSATSKRMRELCYEMLYKKGIVTIEWESDNLGGWFPGRKIWSFSKAASFPQYHLYAKCTSDVSAHLEKCEYYKKWRVDYKSLPERVKLPSLSS